MRIYESLSGIWVANTRALKISIIKLIHRIWNGYIVQSWWTSFPIMQQIVRLMDAVIWKVKNFYKTLYMFLPNFIASIMSLTWFEPLRMILACSCEMSAELFIVMETGAIYRDYDSEMLVPVLQTVIFKSLMISTKILLSFFEHGAKTFTSFIISLSSYQMFTILSLYFS